MPLSHFVTAYPSPSPYPQVHSLVGLCLYSCLAPRFFMTLSRFKTTTITLEAIDTKFLDFFFLTPHLFIYLFIYFFGLCWVFVSVRGLSLVVASGGHSSSWCTGLSLSRPLLLRSTGSRRTGSVVVAHGPSCSAACGIPRPGLEPVSPALAGRFSTTGPPGKPQIPGF